MEKILKYKKILIDFLEDYAAVPPAMPFDTRYEVLCDTQKHHYQLLRIGFGREEVFILATIFHFQLTTAGKILILANNTDLPIGDELIYLGVEKQDIIVGFIHESLRAYTGFAVA